MDNESTDQNNYFPAVEETGIVPGCGFLIKELPFSMGDAGRPARGLADSPTLPGKARIQGKGGGSC